MGTDLDVATEPEWATTCLNCRHELHGPFCAHCGQRAVPPHPTVAELTSDAWQELVGWDGKVIRTLRALLVRPGQATREMLAACDKATTREAVSALLHLDLTAGLPNLRVPTLVVVGTADALTPPRDSRRIAELIPDAQLVEYEGGGHMLMYERTAELDALIMEFARDVQAGAAPADAANLSAG